MCDENNDLQTKQWLALLVQQFSEKDFFNLSASSIASQCGTGGMSAPKKFEPMAGKAEDAPNIYLR